MRDEYLADGLSELQVAALDARSKRQATRAFSGATSSGLADDFRFLNELASMDPERAKHFEKRLFELCGFEQSAET